MYTHKTIALALASALILSGCATTAWQRPPHHPADPGAEVGVTPAVTALERYRSSAVGVPPADANARSDGAMDHSGHRHHEGQP